MEAHRVALARSGGLDGVRDLGLIQSAIARPYLGYYRSIYDKAAALTQSLSKNHGFVDGNKRTALLSLSLFLERSGYQLVGPDKVLVGNGLSEQQSDLSVSVEAEMILDVVENRLSKHELIKWFRVHLIRAGVVGPLKSG